MRATRQISKLVIIGITTFLMMIPALGGQKGDVQYIAIHFGNPEYSKALDRSEYPGFSFFSAPEPVYYYTEAQKLMGGYENLFGWYGELPETMGFGVNATPDKKGSPHHNGTLFVLDAKGTIYYQTPANYGDKQFDGVRAATKKVGKGKVAKALKAKKCKYLKSTAFGELQPSKGSKIDKKQVGMVGWKLPEYQVLDDQGQSVNLSDLVAGKNTVLVFYTMRGGHFKKADTKGNIIKEWDEEPLASLTTGEDVEKTVMDAAPTNAASFLMQAAKAGKAAGAANEPYEEAVGLLDLARDVKKALKH